MSYDIIHENSFLNVHCLSEKEEERKYLFNQSDESTLNATIIKIFDIKSPCISIIESETNENELFERIKGFIINRKKEKKPNEFMKQAMIEKLEKKLKRNDKFRKDYLIKELKTKILEFIKEEFLSPLFKNWFKSERIQGYLPYDFNHNKFNRIDKSSENKKFLSYKLQDCFSEGKKEENGKKNHALKNYEQIEEIINDNEIPVEERNLFKNIFKLTYEECIRLFYISQTFSNYITYELDEEFKTAYANMQSNGKKDGKTINLLEENGFIYYCSIPGNKKH